MFTSIVLEVWPSDPWCALRQSSRSKTISIKTHISHILFDFSLSFSSGFAVEFPGATYAVGHSENAGSYMRNQPDVNKICENIKQ